MKQNKSKQRILVKFRTKGTIKKRMMIWPGQGWHFRCGQCLHEDVREKKTIVCLTLFSLMLLLLITQSKMTSATDTNTGLSINNETYMTQAEENGLILIQKLNKTWISADSPISFEVSITNTNDYEVNLSYLRPGWNRLNFQIQVFNISIWDGPGPNWDSNSMLLQLKPGENITFCSTMLMNNNTIGMDLKPAGKNIYFDINYHYYYIQSLYSSIKKFTILDSDSDGIDDVGYFWEGNITTPPLRFWIADNGSISNKNHPPMVDMKITPSIGDMTTRFEFYSMASDSDGRIISWDWDLGDNNFLSGENVSHSYDKKGDLRIILTVIDNDYNFNISTKQIEVLNILPIINVDIPDEIHINTKFILDASSSTDPDGKIEKIEWNIDNINMTGDIINHSFKKSGWHSINITIQDNDYGISHKEIRIYAAEYKTHSNFDWTYVFIIAIFLFSILFTFLISKRKN